MTTRHGGNTSYPEVKSDPCHLPCEINKNGQAKTPDPSQISNGGPLTSGILHLLYEENQ